MATARRERYRKQTREEAKAVALAQLSESGTAGISVNAIAKAMGMTGPALYRYFASRDELLTELITDTYRDLAETLARAVADAAPADRFRALARALRDWAKRQPDRYLLIYGTPVPGYHAPPETTEIAAGLMRTIFDACATVGEAGEAGEAGGGGVDGGRQQPLTELEAELARHLEGTGPWGPGEEPGGEMKGRALRTWTRLHGVISLDVQGQFTGMGFDPSVLFEAEIDALVRGG
ncbi:TetR/AcrR family transcriptional regulator [Streptomyces malaysiensis subsp. malaysiensis]|uniref:TetR/AcrR family transcriptional regulator n=1 Tax=Streptomyces malaysiensis TaxID=92644 RepID=A0ABX6W2X4_STRMQ|nr:MULTISPECIES: TetR/AcrR family transcriptional regulator [Streptomyces]QPI55855.1 TetR/AcrR family transcriptional regulator [Streptomyces solisilvae]UHH17322.1 TetR/AcrR family transcriptional regulator [Streptomyces sp. HNM0561]